MNNINNKICVLIICASILVAILFEAPLAISEYIYYWAFILLTILIVVYTIKTYKHQTEQYNNLLVSESVLYEKIGEHEFIYVVVVNDGNIPLLDIDVKTDQPLSKLPSKIPFIDKYGHYKLYIGEKIRGKDSWYTSEDEIIKEGNTTHTNHLMPQKPKVWTENNTVYVYSNVGYKKMKEKVEEERTNK